VVLAIGYHPHHSVTGIIWTAITAAVMFALAAGQARTGQALGNPVLRTEGRVTLIDGILATAVLLGLVLNAALSWWWADPPRDTCWFSTPLARSAKSSAHRIDPLLMNCHARPRNVAGAGRATARERPSRTVLDWG
jgi:hypothetical protein